MADDEQQTDETVGRPDHPTPLRGKDEGVPAHPQGKRSGVAADIGALATGLKTTLGKFFSPAGTTMYPDDNTPRPERYPGRPYLPRYANGPQRCIGSERAA